MPSPVRELAKRVPGSRGGGRSGRRARVLGSPGPGSGVEAARARHGRSPLARSMTTPSEPQHARSTAGRPRARGGWLAYALSLAAAAAAVWVALALSDPAGRHAPL